MLYFALDGLLASQWEECTVVVVCICIPHVSLIISLQFTILLLGKIERHLVKVPLAAAISPNLISPTYPTHALKHTPPNQELHPLLVLTSVWIL